MGTSDGTSFTGRARRPSTGPLFKNFPIRERLKFQFRFETFALFNHSNFGNPSATINTSSFGNITSLNSGAPGTRNIQLGVKLQF